MRYRVTCDGVELGVFDDDDFNTACDVVVEREDGKKLGVHVTANGDMQFVAWAEPVVYVSTYTRWPIPEAGRLDGDVPAAYVPPAGDESPVPRRGRFDVTPVASAEELRASFERRRFR